MRGTLVSVAPPAPLAGVTQARPLTTSDVTALGRLMAEAYRGTLDDHGESAQLHEAEARATLAGHYGRPICAAWP